jgi:hypothetical protein
MSESPWPEEQIPARPLDEPPDWPLASEHTSPGAEGARRFIERCEGYWTFAKTMPTMPHWYIVRGRSPLDHDDYDEFVRIIRTCGYRRHYAQMKTALTYMNVDGYRYWTMGEPIPQTTIINRTTVAMTWYPPPNDPAATHDSDTGRRRT